VGVGGGVIVIRLEIEIWVIVKVAKKEGWEKGRGWGERYGGCWVLWPLCVFGCISVVVEGTCVKD
jgi:hypothetical protein